MNGSSASKTPPRCDQAVKRLERAIARLERAAQRDARDDGKVARLESELTQMKTLTLSVTERLDGAIGRIRIALEN
ncbi:MAG: hypothetical protein HQL45_06380 [Alphaproteobacteria bacterium]|nr:hypothetical protein [Alphaproteobacteria bacterium]